MSTLQVTYDGFQHCTAVRMPQNNQAAMDCPYTGKGEEFSPGNMVGSGLAGCMLITMGILAIRDKINIHGTCVDIEMTQSEHRIETIDLVFTMPKSYNDPDRKKLESAAGLCPIKASFHPDISISVTYNYPDQ